MTLWQFMIDISESVLLPSSKSDTLLFYVFGVCSVLVTILRHAVAQVIEVLLYKPEFAGSISDGVLPAALWHWSRLSL